MRLWKAFLSDESGFVLSSEAALVGTVGVIGATVGLSAASTAINDELAEFAYSIRSLDQSYAYEGLRSGSAWTAGSSYTQPPVEESLAKLREQMERDRRQLEEQLQGRPAPQPQPQPSPAVRPNEEARPDQNDALRELELDRRDRGLPEA